MKATAKLGRTNSGDRRIIVKIAFRHKMLITQIPGASYNKDLKAWCLKPTYASCVQLSAIFGDDIEASEELRDFATENFDLNQALKQIRDGELPGIEDCDEFGGKTLYPLQQATLNFTYASPNPLVASDMGTGKTLTSAALAAIERIERGLFVVPNAVVADWAKQLEDVGLNVFVVKGGAATRRKVIKDFEETADQGVSCALVMTWSVMKEHIKLKHYGNIRRSDKEKLEKDLDHIEFDLCVADEAHRMRSPKSKWTRAVWSVNAKKRMALTGTPIANNVGEFWSLLHFLDPEQWPSRSQYIDRYCAVTFNPYGSGSIVTGLRHDTKDELYHLIDRYYIRFTKQDMGVHTPVVHTRRSVQLSPRHRKMYKEFKEEFLAEVDGGFVSARNPLSQNSRLVQLSKAMLKQTHTRDPLVEDDRDRYEMIEPSPTIDELMDLLEGEIPQEEPVIVFSASKQLLHIARARLEKNDVSFVEISGDVTGDAREEAKVKFQTGRVKVCLATPQAAGEGVTLTAARYMVFLARSWSMIHNLQAEDRNNRIGQEADVLHMIDIVTEDTVDETVWEVFGAKTVQLSEITRDTVERYV